MNKRKETPAAPAADEKKSSKRPLKTFVVEDVAASIFARTLDVRGEERTFYSISFSRSYRDANGLRRYVKTFDLDDLGRVITVAQQADEYIRGLIDAESQN